MEFIYPVILITLAIIPLLLGLILFMRYRKNRKLRKLAPGKFYNILLPERSRAKFITKTIFQLLIVACMVVAIAAPVAGIRYRTTDRAGADIILAVDVSKSMACQDVSPSRLDKAKIIMEEIMQQMKNDRVGLVIFGAEGYIQMPLTNDYGAARTVLESLEPGGSPSQGTDLAAAIHKALMAYPKNTEAGKALVILSDGENHEKGAEEAATKAKNNGVTIFTIGIGTAEGGPIPEVKENSANVEYKTDIMGKMVITKLNETSLKTVAEKAGGSYQYGSDPSMVAKNLVTTLDKMEKFKIGGKNYSEADHRYYYFAGAALLLLIIEILSTERPTKLWKRLGFLEFKPKVK